MKRRSSLSHKLFLITWIMILAALAVPIVLVLHGAVFRPDATGSLTFTLKEFKNVLLLGDIFPRAFGNSILYALPITIGQTVVGLFLAFIFSRFEFKFRDALFMTCLVIMIMPFQVTLVPGYNLLKGLRLLDTFIGVIAPQIFLPFGVLFLRQYFLRIPAGMIESAQIDGAGTWHILLRIIVPLGKNGILLLFFLAFVDGYNMFEPPLTVLNTEAKFPLSVVMRAVIEQSPEDAFVPAILYMIPALVLFTALRHNIISGMSDSWTEKNG